MGKPKPPSPPDPQEVAGAQTANNVGTAIASAALGSVNQVTPNGSLTYDQTGATQWTDPNTGNTYDIPQYTATQTLTPRAQEQLAAENRAGLNLANLAADQSQRLGGLLGSNVSTQGLPWGGDSADWATQRANTARRSQQIDAGDVQRAYPGNLNPGAGVQSFFDPQDEQIRRQVRAPSIDQTFDGTARRQPSVYSGVEQVGTRIDDAGRIGRMDASGTDARRYIGPTRDVQTNVMHRANEVTDAFYRGGPVQRGVQGTTLRQSIGDAGDLTRSYGTDFSTDRQRVEEALMSRMNPQLDRDRESLRTSLLNQGIREGSEAFDRAMNRFDEQANDARMQAILAGGQEQSRLAGLEASRARFENAAQNQAFGQEATRAQFQNAASDQVFDQALARGQFANQAQAQQFGQNATAAQFANDATAQRFDQGLARGQFRNAAQQQQFAQQADRAQFENAAAAQQFDQNLAQTNQRNAAQQQQFDQNAAQLQAQNAGVGQRFNQRLGAAQFRNAAQSDEFAQNMARQQFANDARLAQQQAAINAGQFQNAAAGQAFDQRLQGAQFRNAAQAQDFTQQAAARQMRNDAAAQNNAAMFQRQGFNNTLTGQQEDASIALQARRQALRNQALQERFALRNQPINEIGALLGTGQVTQPNFVNANMPGIPTTDRAGLEMDAYRQQMAQWQARMGQRNSLMGGLLGAAGTLGGALIS